MGCLDGLIKIAMGLLLIAIAAGLTSCGGAVFR